MKDAMSLTTIFQIVILFILLFTAIMALTINNSNAFGVKDTIVNAIEQSNGNFYDGADLNQNVVDAITEATYRTTGKCDANFVGYDRNGRYINDPNQDASVCIREVNVTDGIDRYMDEIFPGDTATGVNLTGRYYQVQVFYQLDLPVVNQLYDFSIKGETRIIYS